jgi:predicted O-methyltransferase YrrM
VTDRGDQRADRAAAAAAGIQGWLSEAQGRALFAAAARSTGRGAIVEIGSWKGRSTTWLAHGARVSGARVYAIDPHRHSREDPGARTLDEFLENLDRAGVRDVVEPLVMTSGEAVDVVTGPVELLFVDGDHSADGARRDAQLWLPRVMTGGTVMFHDVATSGYGGPRRVFQKDICRSGAYHRLRRVGSMAVAERTASRSAWQALRSTLFGLLLYRYDLEGALKGGLRRLRRRKTRSSLRSSN